MSNQKSVHDGHRERLRQRYLQNGIEGFSDHELLELILGYSISRKDTNPIGHELIDRFGDLRGVMEAEPQDLVAVDNVGDYTAFLLHLLPGIARRYYEESGNGQLCFSNTERMIDFFTRRFVGSKNECLYAAFLDENYNLIYCEKQFEGSVNSVEIHSIKIVKAAQRSGSSYVVIAHNHNTDSNPSTQDGRATGLLAKSLDRVGIQLLDHIVICGNQGTSMKESGHFAQFVDIR